MIKEAYLVSSFAICGVLGIKTLDLLLGLLTSGVSILSDILSFDRTYSAIIRTKPALAKLDWIVSILKTS